MAAVEAAAASPSVAVAGRPAPAAPAPDAMAGEPDRSEIYHASKSLAAATETLADALASLENQAAEPAAGAAPVAVAVAAPAPAASVAASPAPVRSADPPVVAKATPAPVASRKPAPKPRAPEPSAARDAGIVLGPAQGSPILGQQVAVRDGDTVWDIAVTHYGSAGPVTLKRILSSNPGISDPQRLIVGAQIYLPYQRPDQMVRSDGSSYRVVLAVSPRSEYLAAAEAWVRKVAPAANIARARVHGPGGMQELYIRELPSRDAALSMATVILAEYGRLLSGESRGTV